MSKTKQRRDQAYNDGYRDGKKGLSVQWRHHPQLRDYKRGHRAGRREYQTPALLGYDEL